MTRLNAVVVAAACLLICSVASAQVQRSFVASYGSDANTATNCGFANPCRGFTAAHSVTNSGGEVVALDAAGYGAVTITKAITITANPGFYAGISASSGNAVTVNTTGLVVLRALSINGIGGAIGVSVTAAGGRVLIENCVISGFTTAGVKTSVAAAVRVTDSVFRANNDGIFVQGGAFLDVFRSKFTNNTQTGVWVNGEIDGTNTTGTVTESSATGNGTSLGAPGFTATSFSGATGAARLTVTNSTSAGNGSGLFVGGAGAGQISILTTSRNTVSGKGTGLFNNGNAGGGTSILQTLGDNIVRNNGTETSGTLTSIGGT